MIFLLNCVIKVSLILSFTLIAVRLLRRRSAAFRHCVLTAGILSAAYPVGMVVATWPAGRAAGRHARATAIWGMWTIAVSSVGFALGTSAAPRLQWNQPKHWFQRLRRR